MARKKKRAKPEALSSYATKTIGPYASTVHPATTHVSGTHHNSSALKHYHSSKKWQKTFSEYPVDSTIYKDNLTQQGTVSESHQLLAQYLPPMEQNPYKTKETLSVMARKHHGLPSVKEQEDQDSYIQKYDKLVEENEDGPNYYSTAEEVNYYSTLNDAEDFKSANEGGLSVQHDAKSAPSTVKRKHKRKH